MAFEHPDPLQQVSKEASVRVPAVTGFYTLVAGVAGRRIRIKSWTINNYGAGAAIFDIIDRLGGSDVLIREDYSCAEARNTPEADDDGIYVLRAGADLVFRAKSSLVTHIRVNYWIV